MTMWPTKIKKGTVKVKEVERIDRFDLEYAELQASVGWKTLSKQAKIYVGSSGKKSGIKVPTQEHVGLSDTRGHSLGWLDRKRAREQSQG